MAKPNGPLLEWRKNKVRELKGLERRTFSTDGLELREAGDGSLNLTGYASVTDTPYDVGWYVETIEAGAFRRTLSENPDVQLLINHTGLPLARTRSGTLRLEERTLPDANGMKGLWVDADLDPEDPDVMSLRRKMARGDLDQMSFAFQATADAWNEDFTERAIKACSIHRGDVSVVNMGANPATLASIRSADAIAALGDLGPQVMLAAFREWRDHTLVPVEERAGRTLSAATTEVLTQVLNLVAAADEAIDEAQPLLAELMGVPNPDTDEAAASVETEAGDTVQRAISNETDLRAAIRSALFASDEAERDTIHRRALELGREGLIPVNWAEGRSFAGQEQRETYKDTLMALQCAVEDKLEGEFYSVWVQDFTDTEVIYCAGGDMCSAPYTLVPGGAVTIGDPVMVRPVTEYVPAEMAETERSATPVPVVIPDFTSRAAQEYELLRLREARR